MRLRGHVQRSGRLPRSLRAIAGADISWDPLTKKGYAGIIVFSWPGLIEVERASAQGLASFPYVPGLLSFREGPLLLEAFSKLKIEPDLIFFDGHGMAHPRRFGIASHLGLLLQKPSIGCGKSRLVGEFKMPAQRRGARAPLIHQNETIGAVLRTKDKVQPMFISIGHGIGLADAVRWVLACGDGGRVPKPTREADRFVDQLRRADNLNPHALV
jgi:deoxyribonuclease V